MAGEDPKARGNSTAAAQQADIHFDESPPKGFLEFKTVLLENHVANDLVFIWKYYAGYRNDSI
jgi:hypothetical protein